MKRDIEYQETFNKLMLNIRLLCKNKKNASRVKSRQT